MAVELAPFDPVVVCANSVREVLDQIAPACDVQKLHAPANPQEGNFLSQCKLQKCELGVIAFFSGARRFGCRLRSIVGWIDVVASNDDEAIYGVQGRRCRLTGGREDHRLAAGLLHRGDIGHRHQHGLFVPRPPSRPLDVRGETDERPGAHGHGEPLSETVSPEP